ncbi:MAG: PHP domain-containing protein [Acidaminococcaceae bacterium]|nr:PHP domain-containing protein [Acidaminococcaceae bacterium]MBR1591231.1 PHP domain-containing protein [Acidaminococcaceae bacterium]
MADLHIHSTYSDGVYTTGELAKMARAAGITVIALTDHDTLLGLPEMEKTASEFGLDFIPGVEFSTRWKNRQIHILGYGIEQHNALLLERLADVRNARRTRLQKIITRLHEMGMDVDVPVPEEGHRAVGRPHIARAMVAQGYVKTVQEAFDLYIGEGKPAYQPQTKMTPSEAVHIIHQAGGLAIQAHPEEIGDRELALNLLRTLPYDGIEVYHPSAKDPAAQSYWLHVATERNLLVTGGSDFHGNPGRFPEKLEDWPVPREKVQDFLRRFGL